MRHVCGIELGGHFIEGRLWLEQVLEASPGAPPVRRARALLRQGLLTFMQDDLRGGTGFLEESPRASETPGDQVGAAWAAGWLSVLAFYAGDYERAMRYVHKGSGGRLLLGLRPPLHPRQVVHQLLLFRRSR